MKKQTVRVIVSYIVLFALSACGGGGSGGVSDAQSEFETDSSEIAALVTGRRNYEATCMGCHGSNGVTIARTIDPENCQVADCSSIDTLANYISTYMPITDPQACTLGGEDNCASTTAAYILNGFSAEIDDEPFEPTSPADESVPSPLARLTNDEYVNSVRTLLGLADDSSQVNAARASLASESQVNGLTSDSGTQTLTQLTLGGYSTLAIAASNDFLAPIESKSELEDFLGCPALIENIETSAPTRTCVEEFSKILVKKAYRRQNNDDDADNISRIYDNVIAFNEAAGNALFDITAHKVTLQSILQFIMLSPEFLLIVERGNTDTDNGNALSKKLSDHEIATRMALFIAGTLPDDELLAAADAGLLEDVDIRLQHADRMMNSDIGIIQFTNLLNNWLGIEESLAETADINDLQAFIKSWFVDEKLFSELYQASVAVQHVDGTLSMQPVGVLGMRAFVASHTSFPTPSFINRGAFVVERLLCAALPEDLPDGALDGETGSPLDVFLNHAQQPCATCHQVFDNYGAAFQQFDAETSLFDPSSQEFGSSFNLFDIGDVSTSVSGVDDLGFTLGSSQRASACMAELWYRHSTRRNIDTQGNDDQELRRLVNTWEESDGKSIKALLRSIVASESFITLYR